MIFHDKGGRGVKPKSDFASQGGRGGPDPPKKMTSFMDSPLDHAKLQHKIKKKKNQRYESDRQTHILIKV